MQVSVTDGGTKELVASGSFYPHFQVMSNELSTPKTLVCPEDQKRNCATNFTDLTDRKLGYFLNLDAINGDGSSLLSGDRNITNRARAAGRLIALTQPASIGWTKEIHSEKGYLLFSDCSVYFVNNGSAGSVIKLGNGQTNWLAVP